MEADSAVQLSVTLTASAREAMEAESRSKLPNETGGILVGTVDSTVTTVWATVGPGSKARHGRADFVRDGEYAQRELDALVMASGGTWDYVAEWHSHTAVVGPSSRDLQSMVAISQLPGYDTPNPLLLICCRSSKQSWVTKAYQLRGASLVEIPVRFEEPG